jgi:hypothetical protein
MPNESGDGTWVINRYEGDAKVPPDTEAEAYINFAAFLRKEEHDGRRGARLFESADELIAFCKLQAVVPKASERLHKNFKDPGSVPAEDIDVAFELSNSMAAIYNLHELRTISQKSLGSNILISSELNRSLAKKME